MFLEVFHNTVYKSDLFGQTFHLEQVGAPVSEGADLNLIWNFRT